MNTGLLWQMNSYTDVPILMKDTNLNEYTHSQHFNWLVGWEAACVCASASPCVYEIVGKGSMTCIKRVERQSGVHWHLLSTAWVQCVTEKHEWRSAHWRITHTYCTRRLKQRGFAHKRQGTHTLILNQSSVTAGEERSWFYSSVRRELRTNWRLLRGHREQRVSLPPFSQRWTEELLS